MIIALCTAPRASTLSVIKANNIVIFQYLTIIKMLIASDIDVATSSAQSTRRDTLQPPETPNSQDYAKF